MTASWLGGLGLNERYFLHIRGLAGLSRLSPVSSLALVLGCALTQYRYCRRGFHLVLFAVTEG